MRFDLGGNLGDVILSKNARIVVESVYIPALTNATSRLAVLRLLTSTEDKIFDLKKVLMEILFFFVWVLVDQSMH